MLLILRQLKRIWNSFSQREVFLKKNNSFIEYSVVSFVIVSFQATIKYWYCFTLFLLEFVLLCSTMSQINAFHWDELNPPFLNYKNCVSLHYFTLVTCSRLYLTFWSWSASLIVFIITPLWLIFKPTLTSWPLQPDVWFPLFIHIVIFQHQFIYFHTLTVHIYMQNVRQRVSLFLMVLYSSVLKYLTGHITLESILVWKNTFRSMKALFYYM